jgi:RecB family exonuclease
MADKTKVHTVYKTSDGKRVPSVTTILGILNKPALLDWAWKCGLEGLDYKAVRDNAADIGTLAHAMIQAHLNGAEPDTSEYSALDIVTAENCLIKYWEWEAEHKDWEPVIVEGQFVSEAHKFGGTIDCLMRDGEGGLHLVDHKSSKAIYSDMFIQLAAYSHLLTEAGYDVADTRILRIGKDGTVDFEERVAKDLSKEWDLFTHCRAIYELKKEIR